ncbi:imm11 family protein [Crocosphaera chwakensis]|uniref:Immunity MXAN-0049 protein domain-containing protein n=1 Tax=Crocosphaera chwakensis CCY0110 TaxID=391612 RepID=A3IN97_9CHRO|nr:DUF1629 domain-containing protein [Crocosphaera chwakensis]EAZ92074.1 hypothetical protein CY0110_00410 [Crocosphaera chwakensis CCY0110]
MKIWDIDNDVKNFVGVNFVSDDGGELQFCPDWPYFEGQRLGEDWSFPYRVKLLEDKPVGDFIGLDSGLLFCDSYALIKLKPYIIKEVEIIPTNVDGLDLNILNITNLIDCLDKEKSVIEYFDEIEQGIMDVEKYVFKEELLENVTHFKLPQLTRSSIFGTDKFYSKVKEYGLTGLKFELVYSTP